MGSRIVWDKFLENRRFLLCIQITEDGPSSFTFSEQGPLPQGMAGMDPRNFKTQEEAIEYAEANYIPGRKTQGWKLKEPGSDALFDH